MSYSLNSLKGFYRGLYRRVFWGLLIKGDTGSLDSLNPKPSGSRLAKKQTDPAAVRHQKKSQTLRKSHLAKGMVLEFAFRVQGLAVRVQGSGFRV